MSFYEGVASFLPIVRPNVFGKHCTPVAKDSWYPECPPWHVRINFYAARSPFITEIMSPLKNYYSLRVVSYCVQNPHSRSHWPLLQHFVRPRTFGWMSDVVNLLFRVSSPWSLDYSLYRSSLITFVSGLRNVNWLDKSWGLVAGPFNVWCFVQATAYIETRLQMYLCHQRVVPSTRTFQFAIRIDSIRFVMRID